MANELFAERQRLRWRIERADDVIRSFRTRAVVERDNVPPMEASDEDLKLTETANITVSAEWLAFMFQWLDGAGEELSP